MPMCLAGDLLAGSTENLRTRRRCCRTLKFAGQRVSVWCRNSVATRRGKSIAEFTAPGASQILPCLWHFDEILPCLLHPSPSASQDVPNPYLTRTHPQGCRTKFSERAKILTLRGHGRRRTRRKCGNLAFDPNDLIPCRVR